MNCDDWQWPLNKQTPNNFFLPFSMAALTCIGRNRDLSPGKSPNIYTYIYIYIYLVNLGSRGVGSAEPKSFAKTIKNCVYIKPGTKNRVLQVKYRSNRLYSADYACKLRKKVDAKAIPAQTKPKISRRAEVRVLDLWGHLYTGLYAFAKNPRSVQFCVPKKNSGQFAFTFKNLAVNAKNSDLRSFLLLADFFAQKRHFLKFFSQKGEISSFI